MYKRQTLNRPDAGNAINLAFVNDLLAAATRVAGDASIRCVVLMARGRFFSVGGDLDEFAAAGEGVSSFLADIAGTLHRAIACLMRMEKPLLVLVNGPAAGAGLSLAIMGDVVLAAREAGFAAGYGRVGLSPDGGMSWMLPRLAGLRLAQDMIIANRRLTADEAQAHGLVTCVVDDLAAEGQRRAAELAAGATGAMGAARMLLLESAGGGFEAHLDLEMRTIAACAGSPAGHEGVAAFLAKRKPDFKGAG